MSPKWLTSLVRARQVQEDFAKQQLATAERLATRAHARVRYDNDRVESLVEAGAELNAPSFVAAAVALQAAAATHAAALRAADDAVARVADRRGDLTEAARARYVAEELHEKHATAERQRAGAFAQREMDEIAARVFRDGTDGAR
jgi:flagellar export protein FliJ